MSTPRPPDNADRPDDLKQRYLQASAAQTVGPSERVRRAALDHAQMLAASASPVAPPQAKPTAANRWNFTLVASVAIAGVSALLALQFDRSDSEDKAVVLGTPSVTAPPVAAQPAPVRSPDLNARTSAADAANKSVAESADQSAAQSAPESPAVPAARPAAKAQAPKPTAAPNLKEPPTEALARPAPAAPLVKSESESQSEKASVERPFQATPPTAQKRSERVADAEVSAQPAARAEIAQSSVQPAAPIAAMKSRSAAPLAAAPAAVPIAADALRSAARSGQIALLEQALQQASIAQVNASDENGRTPLMLATLGGHIGAVQRLLTAGADPALKDSKGNTAAQLAEQLGYTVIRNLLVKEPVAQ